MLKSITFIIAGLCLAVPISGQNQPNGAPLNCVLNEKRPNPLNPYTFYSCRSEGLTLMKCPHGLIFDSRKLDCVKQVVQHANNSTGGNLPDVLSSSAPQLMGWSSWGWSPPVSCPAQDPEFAVLLPDPHHCSLFYICSNGTPYLFVCPAGLYFNPVLEVCDWPSDAGCTAGQPKVASNNKLV